MPELESRFQRCLRAQLEELFPGCIILKNDPNLQQGIPDLTVLWRSKWAFLEVKRSADEAEQPNQRWFVDKANAYAFGAFVYPENAEEVLNDLQRTFRSSRKTRPNGRE